MNEKSHEELVESIVQERLKGIYEKIQNLNKRIESIENLVERQTY